MGQGSEEAAELVATIRSEHVVMKNWFMGSSKEATALRQKYGPYPALWKEVLNWPGWKDARKSYLVFTQTGGTGGSSSPPKTDSIPRKRRSRWGVVSDNNEDNNNDANGPNKRRSRWGSDQGVTATAPAPAPSIPRPLPGLGLPGIPANLPPEKQAEMRKHQARLKDINHRLENLEQEAARVDALPRGHRDRSPSPPPGKLLNMMFIFVSIVLTPR
jgi:hypothetical protein